MPPDAPVVESLEPEVNEDALLEEALVVMTDDDPFPPQINQPKPAPTQKAAVQPKPEEKKPEEKIDEDELARKAAAITAKGRRLRERVEEWQGEKTKHEAEVAAGREEIAEWKAKAQSSPLQALEALGWTYEDLQTYVLSDGQVPFEKRMREVEEKFGGKLTEQAKQLEEHRKQIAEKELYLTAETYKQSVERNVDALLQTGEFPMTKRIVQAGERSEMIDAVLGKLTQEYRASKKALAPRDVLVQIENRLTRQLEMLQSGDPQRAGAVKSAKPEAGREPRSLSNELTASRAVRPPQDEADVDEDELERRAVAAILEG